MCSMLISYNSTVDFDVRTSVSDKFRMGYGILVIAFFGLLAAFLYRQKVEKLRRQRGDAFELTKFESDSATTVLFVTSHPDDECMFFGPTLRHLISKNITVHLLCLSTGNYYGIGETRRVELLNACLKLGIFPSQIHLLESFHDDINKFWDEEEIALTVDKFVKLVAAEAVFTFDEGGVSGHRNHISTSKGVQNIRSEVPVFQLVSVNLIRKYIQLFDIVLSVFNPTAIASNFNDFRIAYNAMTCHRSQLTIARRLYIIFSRYMLINSWSKVR